MSLALERARAAHAALVCARAAPDPGDARMVNARAFADAVKAIGGYTAAVDPDKGGSVYVTVTPGGFKARFADHGGFFDFAISIDPLTGNTVAGAVALFKHAIDASNPLPVYQTSSIDPPTGRQFSAEAEFNRNAYLMGRNPSSRNGQGNEAQHAPPKKEPGVPATPVLPETDLGEVIWLDDGIKKVKRTRGALLDEVAALDMDIEGLHAILQCIEGAT